VALHPSLKGASILQELEAELEDHRLFHSNPPVPLDAFPAELLAGAETEGLRATFERRSTSSPSPKAVIVAVGVERVGADRLHLVTVVEAVVVGVGVERVGGAGLGTVVEARRRRGEVVVVRRRRADPCRGPPRRRRAGRRRRCRG
jgi:aspartate aminotransferase-like enzyme